MSIVLTLLIIQSLGVKSCSDIFFLSSNNTICEDVDCQQKMDSLMMLELHNTICFLGHDGVERSITFNTINHVGHYNSIYLACDYYITTDSTWSCWKSGGSCNTDECTPNTIQNAGLPKTPNSNNTYWTGCFKQGDCPGGCGFFAATRCLWGVASVIPTKCYPVLVLTEITWETTFTIKVGKETRRLTATSNNPIITDEMTLGVNYIKSTIHDNLFKIGNRAGWNGA